MKSRRSLVDDGASGMPRHFICLSANRCLRPDDERKDVLAATEIEMEHPVATRGSHQSAPVALRVARHESRRRRWQLRRCAVAAAGPAAPTARLVEVRVDRLELLEVVGVRM